MTDDITALIEQGKKLAEAAETQHPWIANGRYIRTKNRQSVVAECRDVNGNWCDDAKTSSNAAHIAHHSPATMLRLYAEIDRLSRMHSDRVDLYWKLDRETDAIIKAKDAEIARLREAIVRHKAECEKPGRGNGWGNKEKALWTVLTPSQAPEPCSLGAYALHSSHCIAVVEALVAKEKSNAD